MTYNEIFKAIPSSFLLPFNWWTFYYNLASYCWSKCSSNEILPCYKWTSSSIRHNNKKWMLKVKVDDTKTLIYIHEKRRKIKFFKKKCFFFCAFPLLSLWYNFQNSQTFFFFIVLNQKKNPSKSLSFSIPHIQLEVIVGHAIFASIRL